MFIRLCALFGCILFFSSYAHAYTVASTSTGTWVGAASNSITIPSSAAGDTIYVLQGGLNNATNATAPTDNKGSTYTKVNETISGGTGAATLWKADNVVSAITSVTVTNSSTAPYVALVREYNGLSNPAIDVHAISAQITGTNPTSPNVTTNFTNEAIIGYMYSQINTPPTVGAGYGNFSTVAQSTVASYLAIEDKAGAAAGSYNASFVSALSATYIAGIIGALTPSSAGGSSHLISLMGVGN